MYKREQHVSKGRSVQGTERYRRENPERRSPVSGGAEDHASEGPSNSGNTADP